MKYYIMLSALYLSSVLYAQCDTCRIRVDGTFAGTSVPVDSLYAALRDRYHNLVVDTDVFTTAPVELYPESSDVYGVLLGAFTIYSTDSVFNRFKNFVYNGGILILFGETCLGGGAAPGIVTRWPDLGFSYHPTTVVDSVDYWAGHTYEAAIYRNFAHHPLIPDIDSVYLDRGGSIGIVQNSRARRLVWGGPTAYALDCDSCGPYTPPEDWVIWETAPTLVGISHYGRGIVVYHADYSNFRFQFEDLYLFDYDDLELDLALFNCNVYPHIHIFPPGGEYYDSDSLELDTVKVIINNYGAIEPESLRLSVKLNDIEFPDAAVSSMLDITDSMFTLDIPDLLAGDELDICILSICDTAGYWPYDSICWSYRISFTPFVSENEEIIEDEYYIYPNPFNTSTLLSGPENERIEIYNIKGELIRREILPFVWNGTDKNERPLSSGIYLIHYESTNKIRKAILLK